MTKFGGFLGAGLLIALVLYVGDRMDWTADLTDDTVVTAVLVVVGVIGWLAGSRIARRLATRRSPAPR